MKLGTENRTKTLIAAALLIVAGVLGVRAFRGDQSAPPPPPVAAKPSPAAPAQPAKGSASANRKPPGPLLAKSLDPSLRLDLLKTSEDVEYKGAGRDIFHAQPEAPPIPKPLPPDKQPKPAYTPPAPPPINLKFYGFAGPKNGNKRIFLLKGEDIFVAKEGDIVDRRYKIVHIGPNSVDVEDVLTNNRQTLPLSMS